MGYLLVLLGLISVALCGEVPFITKCHKNDDACTLKSTKAAVSTFVKGLPEYKVKPLDPMKFDTIDASIDNLKFILNNAVFHGVAGCDVSKMKMDSTKVYSVVECPLVEGNADYVINGKLLIINLATRGELKITIPNLVIGLEADYVDVEKNGEKYWKIKSFKHKFEIKGKAGIHFKDYESSDAIVHAVEELVEKSGNEVILELAPPVLTAVVKEAVHQIEHFFSHVPVKYLSLD